jgi:hypothetical protein
MYYNFKIIVKIMHVENVLKNLRISLILLYSCIIDCDYRSTLNYQSNPKLSSVVMIDRSCGQLKISTQNHDVSGQWLKMVNLYCKVVGKNKVSQTR